MKDLTNNRFGRLLVIKLDHIKKYSVATQHFWECACDCGATKIVSASHLNAGNTNSCGCFRKENTTLIKTKHGKRNTPTYNIWSGMKQRCLNAKSKYYNDYGGRGITVCERWLDGERGFINFLEDMGEKPSKEYSIERVDNNGNYEPSNCEWLLRSKQGRNQRRSVFNEALVRYVRTSSKASTELADELNINVNTIYDVRNFHSWKDIV